MCTYSPTLLSPPSPSPALPSSPFQVMETKNMLYLVTEYAKNGEIFGELSFQVQGQSDLKHYLTMSFLQVSIAHKKKTVVSVMFLTNKEVSKSCWACAALSYPGLNLKGHMIDGYLRTMSWYGPCHVLQVIAVLKVFFWRIKWHHWEAASKRERFISIAESLLISLLLRGCARYQDYFQHNCYNVT